MLSESDLDRLVFRTMSLITGLDKFDICYDFKVAVLEKEIEDVLSQAQIKAERRRLDIHQEDYERNHDRALIKARQTE